MQYITIKQAKNHVITFFDFVVQPGMFSGYTDKGIPFTSNGNIYNDNYMYINLLDGKLIDGIFSPIIPLTWEKIKINKGENIFDKIAKKSKKRGELNYMTKSELEFDRWGKYEFNNGESIHNIKMKSSKPYDGKFTDAKYRVKKTSHIERTTGVEVA